MNKLGTKKSKAGSFQRERTRLFFLYVSPWLIGFSLFTLVPMVMSLVFSFTNVVMSTATSVPLEFVNFKHYVTIFTKDPDFITSISNTFIMAVLKVVLLTTFSLLIAILLNQKLPGKKIYRVCIYLPSVIPVVSVSLLWKLMFLGETNIINYLISLVGGAPVNFFANGTTSRLTLVFIGVWGGLGPNMFIFLAALQGVPNDIIEASQLDGAGPISRFFHIIVPTIAPTVFFVSLTGMIGSLQMYAEVKLLTNGGPGIETLTMNLAIVRNAFQAFGKKTLGYASAQAWVVFVIVLTLTIIVNTIKAKMEKE